MFAKDGALGISIIILLHDPHNFGILGAAMGDSSFQGFGKVEKVFFCFPVPVFFLNVDNEQSRGFGKKEW